MGQQDFALRSGKEALQSLLDHLRRIHAQQKPQLCAKIVGGALDEKADSKTQEKVISNIAKTRQFLEAEGVSILGEDLGGQQCRKVLFHLPTGRLQVAMVGKPLAMAPKIRTQEMPSADRATVEAMKKPKISPRKVLIVDDSKTIRDLLTRICRADSELEVIGVASSGFEAESFLQNHTPDVITLDVNMPQMTGVEFLERQFKKRPIPVVMISSLQLQEGNEIFRALELGAVDYIQKPSFAEMKELGPIICETIKDASFAKVRLESKIVLGAKRSPRLASSNFDERAVLAIGASTGGTEAIKEILLQLPSEIPPTLVVQHIPAGFSKAFADRLNDLCPFEVKEAVDGDELLPSRVLIAPGGKQMAIDRKKNGRWIVRVNDDPPMSRHKPSVDYLFHSVAKHIGAHAVGVIMTGMGADGAEGLLAMKKAGSVTIGQDETSCVVYGMPKAAHALGAVDWVVELAKIPETMMNRLAKRNHRPRAA